MRLRPDFDEALWLIQFIRERQPDGKFLLCAFKDKRPVLRRFLDNRDPNFDTEALRWLKQWADGRHHIFYAVNAFTEKRATAEFVRSSRLAHVDADNVRVPPPGPAPTLIVNTSPGNHQFIYELDAEVSGEEIEAINRKLTRLVGGDTGHSRAKLLRLAGTHNVKPDYDPTPLVTILRKNGPVHRARDLLGDAHEPVAESTAFEGVEELARALSADEIRKRY